MRVALIAFAMMFGTASAQAQHVSSIQIREYGIYTSDVTKRHRQRSGLVHSSLTNIRHAATTTTIPAQKGVRFGFRYHITGSPRGRKVRVRKVTIFPAPGLKMPKSTKPLPRNSYFLTRTIGETSYTGYSFDNSWEMVPGVWTFQLWVGNRMLAKQSFKVVAP